MEAEVRAILREALTKVTPADGLGSRIHQRFASAGGVDLDVEVLRSREAPRVPELPA